MFLNDNLVSRSTRSNMTQNHLTSENDTQKSLYDTEDIRRATRNFSGQGRFVKLGHFDNISSKILERRAPQGKILELFFLGTLKTTF